jgi:nucleoporin NUP2
VTGGFGSPSGLSTPASSAPSENADGESQDSTDPAAFVLNSSVDIEGVGEENETTEFTARGRLQHLDVTGNKWASLGVGNFKIKKHKDTGKTRVLFRTEGGGNVIAVRPSISTG